MREVAKEPRVTRRPLAATEVFTMCHLISAALLMALLKVNGGNGDARPS